MAKTRTVLSLTHERLLSVLDYDPETGIFTNCRTRSARAVSGDVAGSINAKNGYRTILIDYERHLAHRLAWFYMTKTWPKNEIDHIDTNPDNNAFANLREATYSQNHANRGLTARNTSGYKGVSWHEKGGKWWAKIVFKGQFYSLGLYDDPAEAHAAYCEAARRFHGKFARDS